MAVAGSAQAVLIGFFGSGLVTGPAQVPPQFIGLQVKPADSQYVVDDNGGWTMNSLFDFNVGSLTGNCTATFSNGVDSIFASFTSSSVMLGAPLDLIYAVTGGAGAHNGWTGSGSSSVQLLGNPLGLAAPIPFMETGGVLNIVAEPGTWLLVASGLALALRRRTSLHR